MLALLNLLTANVLSFTQYPSASRKLSALHTLLHSHTYNTHSTQFLVCKDQFSKASEHHGWQHWRHCQEGLGRYLEETQGQDLWLQQCKSNCKLLRCQVVKSCDLGSGQQLLSTNDQVHQSEGYLWSFYGKETCGNARQTWSQLQ